MRNRQVSAAGLAALVLLLVAPSACEEKKPPLPATANTPDAAGPTPEIAAPAVSSAPKPPPTSITAQHVLVAYKGAKGAPKTVTRTKAEALRRAEVVASRAKSDDFTALVAEYSDDPGSKERSGSLGRFTREKMTKPFADAAFALAVDETSGVVETDFGFHVVKRNQ